MRNFVKYLLLAEAFAVTTFGLGWWTVPIVAALWGIASSDSHRARNAAIAAAAGWATLLLIDVARGQVGVMGNQLGSLMSVPAPVLYLLTLLFPALLAWSAAAIVPGLRETGKPAA
jgi:hypothetical protein